MMPKMERVTWKIGRMTWCHCTIIVLICCGNQTPSWLPSSPKGEIVGNMMQSVVLDGNPLNGDEDMRLLTCVVLDGNPPDEVILDLMDLVNDVNLM
jgi:hypothetical protein